MACDAKRTYTIQMLCAYSLEATLMVAELGSFLQWVIFQTDFSTCNVVSVAFSLQWVEWFLICEFEWIWLPGVLKSAW